jgi:dolichol-phosphate mannosyltransferase
MAERISVLNLSIVIPAYNEQEVVAHTLKHVYAEAIKVTDSFEIIIVDDGSTDQTANEVLRLKNSIPQLRLISNIRNYGHSESLITGICQSKGTYVLTMDVDMQHPPRLIPEMYDTMRKNADIDVVQGLREGRDFDSIPKKIAAKFFYYLITRLTNLRITPNASDFRLMNASSVKSIKDLPEKNKTIRFLIPYLGLKVQILTFKDEARFAGKSKYSWKKMFNFGLSSVISFSAKPLYTIALIGFLASVVLILSAISTFLVWLFAKTIPGWTSIVLFVLSSNAVILASLGLLGLYIGRIYETTLGRPSSIWHEIE